VGCWVVGETVGWDRTGFAERGKGERLSCEK
jgi:hypothetical protein